jgi:hypothetical protein
MSVNLQNSKGLYVFFFIDLPIHGESVKRNMGWDGQASGKKMVFSLRHIGVRSLFSAVLL